MEIQFVPQGPVEGEALSAIATLVFEGPHLSVAAEQLDAATSGALSRAISGGRFTGAKGQTCDLVACHGLHAARVVLAGAGSMDGLTDLAIEDAAAQAYAAVKTSGVKCLELRLEDCTPAQAAHAAFGIELAAYRFDKYLTRQKPEKKPSIETVRIVAGDPDAAVAAFAPLAALANGVCYTRDLVSEPANILHPEEFADRVRQLEELGLEVDILGEQAMVELGMGALLGVGRGSRRQSQLAILKWLGAAEPNSPPVVFVGKGVTFDTGGISIKPALNMEEMKTDMGGAGAVAGLMHTLAARNAKVNVIGVLGLVENMPDGDAQRPGDIVTSMSGQTIEVINTDAEGRLVLADALWYAEQTFKPRAIIDLATLTGAIVVALGPDYAGVYSNNDALAGGLIGAAKAEGDNMWRMPLPPQYEKLIDSPAADMKNIGGPAGGSITAALFLQRFIKDTPWAHLDIAPVAWKKSSTAPTIPDGASGYGVRLLNRLVADVYEDA